MGTLAYQEISQRLELEFATVEADFLAGIPPEIQSKGAQEDIDSVFASATQAYREVLLGCVLAKLYSPDIDVHKPYMNQGENSYNGRTLDERVVNPFLHDKRIPSSRGPFLSAFRRSVKFEPSTREGLRDKVGFDALLRLVDSVDAAQSEDDLIPLLRYLLFRFILLRDAAAVPLVRLQRMSLDQFNEVVTGLLATPSGGRFPVILVETALYTIRETYNLDWRIEAQGINVADRQSGAGGDITVRRGESVLFAAEVTEREIERNRIVATFQAKIAPSEIADYIFFVTGGVDHEALRQARQYFAQGHEINFVGIAEWLWAVLATVGRTGREAFNRILGERLERDDIPVSLRTAWNEQIAKITSA